LIANISGTDQAIDKRKTALATTIFSTLNENNLVNFGPLRKNDLELRQTTLKFNTVGVVVKVHVHAKYHQAECSGSRVTVLAEKKLPTKTKLSVATADSKNEQCRII